MKKTFVTLVCLGFVLTMSGVASANSLIIPFFSDGGARVGTSPQTAQGVAAFIGVKSLTDATIVCAVTYTDTNGLDGTPAENTFELGPLSAKTFRPVIDDPGAESTGVPDADPVGTLTPVDTNSDGIYNAGGNGGCIITTTGMIVGNCNSLVQGISSTHAYTGVNAD